MPELNWNVILSGLAYAALTGIFNLVLGRKSQIEAYATANPRLAAILKISRAMGFDPWNVISGLSLAFTKKLPEIQQADSKIAKLEQAKADAKKLDPDSTVKVVPGGPLLMLVCAGMMGMSQQGCSGAQPSPTCTDAAYRTQLLSCGVMAADCVRDGGTDELCGAVCNKEWDDWQERCSQ